MFLNRNHFCTTYFGSGRTLTPNYECSIKICVWRALPEKTRYLSGILTG
jgi:hypothetical protein